MISLVALRMRRPNNCSSSCGYRDQEPGVTPALWAGGPGGGSGGKGDALHPGLLPDMVEQKPGSGTDDRQQEVKDMERLWPRRRLFGRLVLTDRDFLCDKAVAC